MSLDILEKLARTKREGAGKSSNNMRMGDKFATAGDSKGLRKTKIELTKAFTRLYATEIALPFNPNNPADADFGYSNPFIMDMSPTTAVLLLKHMATENEELKAKLDELAGGSYDISDKDNLTEADMELFRPFRRLLHYAVPVQKFNFSAYASGGVNYGRRYRSRVEKDHRGRITKQDVGFMIYMLENAFCNDRIEKINKEYEEGIRTGSEDDKKKEITAERQKMLAKKPNLLGSLRVIEFEVENNKPKLEASKIADELVKFDRYTSGSTDDLNKFDEILNNPDIDRYWDFVAVGLSYNGNYKGDTETDKKLEAWKGINFIPRTIDEKIVEAYRVFRDSEERWTEDFMIDGVWDYQDVSDEELISGYKNDLILKYQAGLITEQIATKFQDTLARIDGSLSTNLIDDMLDDKLAKGTKVIDAPEDNIVDLNDVEGVGVLDQGEQAPVTQDQINEMLQQDLD